MKKGTAGFTLVEVMTSVAIAGFVAGGIIAAYALAAQHAEWSTTKAAAHRSAIAELERWRAARWHAGTNEYVPGTYVSAVTLSLPETNASPQPATNRTTISLISTNPPLVFIKTECIWAIPGRGPFTNEVYTYRAPDQ